MIGVFAIQAYRQKRPYRKELIVVTKVPFPCAHVPDDGRSIFLEKCVRRLVLRIHWTQMTFES